MDANEFKAWLSRNEGSGGKRPKSDGFNKSMKGHERNPSAPEFATKGIPEYNHYAERESWRKEEEEKRKQDDQKKDRRDDSNNAGKNASSSGAGNAGQIAQGIVRNIVPKVALVVGGSVVVVGGYTEMKAKEARAAVTSTVWVWSDDNSSAKLDFLNGAGDVVRSLPATITTVEKAATCTQEGLITYKAGVKDGSKSYADERSITLNPLGHLFDEGVKSLVDGIPTITYTCQRCDEIFVVTVSPEEIDPDNPEFHATWFWSEDHSSCEVELSDDNGDLVKRVPAEVSVTATEATCVTEGKTVYKASLEEGWYTYSTTHTDVTPALGHLFGAPVETIVDGKPSLVYECSRCGEKIVITIDITEEDEEENTSSKQLNYVAIEKHLQSHENHHHCGHHHHM